MNRTKYTTLALLASLCWGTMKAQQTFTTGQAASIVIGQPNFNTGTSTVSSTGLSGPSGCAVGPNGVLVVFQQSSNRASIWNALPTTNGVASDAIIGPNSFTSSNSGTSASLLRSPNGGALSPDGKKVLIADSPNNRILIWNSIPTTNGTPADIVLGQTSFTTRNSGTSASLMNGPRGAVISPDGRLLVTDALNHRVLIWNKVPTTNGAPADIVLGQPNFTNNTVGTASNKMNEPWEIAISPNGELVVADEDNNRILIWDSIPTINNVPADRVIGQSNFTSNNTGTTASSLNNPIGVSFNAEGMLAISEFGNNRVLLYNQLPTTNGASADVVLGQASFTSNSSNITSTGMNNPYGSGFDVNGRLFVAGRDMHRAMVFGTLPTETADLAISIQSNQSTFCPGNAAIYEFIVQNNGTDTARNIAVSSSLPYELGLGTYTLSTPGATYNQRSGYLSIPYLANGESCTLRLETIVPGFAAGKTYTVMASLEALSTRDVVPSNNSASAMLSVSNGMAPPAPTVSNDTVVCSSSSLVLTASGMGTLNWYDAPTGGNLVNTGTTYTLNNLTNGATYYVEALNGCASNRAAIQVGVEPAPTANIVGTGTTFCIGDGTFLLSNNTNNNQWNLNGNPIPGATDSTYMPTQSGFYTVSNTACNNVSPALNITVVQPTVPVVTASGSLTICDTDSVTLTSNQTSNIIWSTGETTPSITVSTAGMYYVTYTDANNCSANSDTSMVVVNATPLTPSISANGTVLASSAPTGNQWYLNGNLIPGATGQFYTATQSGFYQVIVSNGNCSASSNTISITIVGVDAVEAVAVRVFPNPSTGLVNIVTDLGNHHITIFDAVGQTVLSRTATAAQYSLDLNELPEGVYILQVHTEDQAPVFVEKLILQR